MESSVSHQRPMTVYIMTSTKIQAVIEIPDESKDDELDPEDDNIS